MKEITIDSVLAQIRAHLDLSSQTEHELLLEIRSHLEDAVDEARERGFDESEALISVAQRFGGDEVGSALQDLHLGWESADAIVACALPVLATLVLRWLIFAPDGTALGWQELLIRPAFWIIAVAALLLPLIQFRQWRYALAGWGFFWALSILFVAFPTFSRW